MKLIIEDDEGRKTVVPVVREEITIGRQDGNTIRLTERNVSRRHARLLKENGSLVIEDLGSYNGVRVNGEKITGPTKIKEGDLVEIGDYDLGIQGKLDTPMASDAVSKPPPSPKQTTIPPGTVKAPVIRTTPLPQQPVSAPPASAASQAAAPPPTQEKPAPAPQAAQAPSAGGATAIIRVSDIMKSAPQGGEARDLDRTEMPRLVGLAGPFRAKEFYLMRSEVKFGRTEENDIVADHQSVSRTHCKFVLDQGQWKVIDNKSANGVRVNGEEYAVSNIKPGDTVELGHLKFRFCGPGEKFSPPAEKAEGGEAQKGKQPTTAELIAGASQPGRMGTTGPQKAVRPGPNKMLLAGIAGAVVLVVVVVVVLTRGGRKEEGGEGGSSDHMSAAEAVKAGDAAFKKHEFGKANEYYERAVAEGTTPSNRKKALEEAKGETAYSEMESALSSGDVDKARTQFEKCPEGMYWCQKAQEKGDAVKQAYAKKHLAVASAAKAAGKADVCSNEVNAVLAFDASNAEAQGIQCSPESAKPPPEKHEGPSPAERNSKAAKLSAEAFQKLVARDFPGAMAKANEAVKQNAPDKKATSQAYRVLGYLTSQSDAEAGKKYLEKYYPYCTDDCDKVKAFLGK